jgi:hypothetical protein
MLHRSGRFPEKAASRIPYSAGGARRLALRGGCEGRRSAGAGWNRGARKKRRGGGEGPGTASGGISRGLEFWREFVEDGACCDRVSLGEPSAGNRESCGRLPARDGRRVRGPRHAGIAQVAGAVSRAPGAAACGGALLAPRRGGSGSGA